MKKLLSLTAIFFALCASTFAQKQKENEKESKSVKVPTAVKAALSKKYPAAKKVTWEEEKGNYEANWGGKEGEDHSVQFTPAGEFIEIINAIPVSQLPTAAIDYVKKHYKGAKISEATKVTDATGKISYEAEVNKKDILFDANGDFVKVDD